MIGRDGTVAVGANGTHAGPSFGGRWAKRLVLLALVTVISFGALYLGLGGSEAGNLEESATKTETNLEATNQLATSGLGTAALRSSRTGSPLPPLAMSPQEFAQSDANPFRCLRTSLVTCDPHYDPMIAGSPAEARWMAARGFPTAPDREWARNRSSRDVWDEGIKRGSTPLKMLALQKAALNTESVAEAANAGARLAALAESEQKSFGLLAAAQALFAARALELEKSGTSSRHGSTAIRHVAKAMLLGDSKAARLIDDARTNRSASGVDYILSPSENSAGIILAAQAAAWADLRYAEAEATAGKPPHGFRMLQVQPRPVALAHRNFDAAGVETDSEWVGED